jgi:fluoroacetyl-CoA thioesterase
MKFPGIVIGDTITIHKTVSEEDTVGNHWSLDIERLLSTPGLVSMMIEASTQLIDSKLPEGFMSIGKSAEVTHEHPTVLGANVGIKVTIKSFDGYHITLKMTAYDDAGIMGRGTHVRSIVNRHWTQLKIARRVASL